MKRTTALILALCSLFLTFSCKGMIGNVRTSLVTVTVGSSGVVALEVKPATLAEKARRFLAKTFSTPAANASIPAIVQDLRLTVSADDIATITATVNVVGLDKADFIVEVPNGPQRLFFVEGLDSAGAIQYSGKAISDLTGDPVLLTINMVSAASPPPAAALTVLSTEPANGAVNVPIDAVITVLFDKPLDTTSINSSSFTLKDNAGALVTGTVLASGSTATFTPAAPLTHSASYTATVTTAVKDPAGNALAADVSWSFTVAADGVPPTFTGLSLATNLSITTMQLSWAPASDNVTPSAKMVYLVYQATSAGGENFASPTFTTAAGVTSFVVKGLTPGATYFFSVRARDEAGNTDANVVEKTLTYPGRYVATTGLDTNACTPSAPCATIAQAQRATAANEGIFVAAGSYTLTSGLTLTTGNALACTGPNHTTVINTQGGAGPATIIGSQGVVIEGCRIVDLVNTIPMIKDNGADIVVNDCILQGVSGLSSQGIELTGNSTIQNSIFSTFIDVNGGGSAILISGGSAVISSNTFTANANGITIPIGAGGQTPVITNNIFTGNSTGINVQTGSPTIIGNTIGDQSVRNAIGISVSGGTPSITANKIFCSLSSDLRATLFAALDIPNNSWDHDPPANEFVTAGPCITAGVDICSNLTVTAIPAGPAVTNGCNP